MRTFAAQELGPLSPRRRSPTLRSGNSSGGTATIWVGNMVDLVEAPAQVVLGEDDVLLREGIVRLLTETGFDVVGQAGDAEDLLRKALAHDPDVVIADVQMPPGNEDDGLQAALEIRRRRPGTGVLVLSNFYEEAYALKLIGESAEGVGYLLKQRIG